MTKSYDSNVRLYYGYAMLREPILWGPILVIYIQSVSFMSLAEIYLMEASCVTIASLLQIPTGHFADRYGRKNSMIVGLLFILTEMILFTIASSKTEIWISNTFWAIGYSFMSGADSALLYDSLRAIKRQREYRKIEGKVMCLRYLVVAAAVISSGYLATIYIRLPCMIDTVIIMTCFFVVFAMREAPHEDDSTEHGGLAVQKVGMLNAIKCCWHNKKMVWIIALATTVSVTSKLWFFTYNPYFKEVGIKLIYYGYIFMALNVVAAISSYYAHAVSNRLSSMASIALSLSCIFIPILVMGILMEPWAVLMVLPQNFVRPFINSLLHENISSRQRATMISVKSSIHQLMEVMCMVVFALLISEFTLGSALTCLGLVTGVISIVLLVSYGKYFNK